jgi:hypothetical protein
MPQVTIRTVVDNREESISEYICDWPDCPDIAVTVVGVARGLGIRTAMCKEHADRFVNGSCSGDGQAR